MLFYINNLKTIVYSYPLSIPPLFAQKIFRPLPLSLIPAAFYLLSFVPTSLVRRLYGRCFDSPSLIVGIAIMYARRMKFAIIVSTLLPIL